MQMVKCNKTDKEGKNWGIYILVGFKNFRIFSFLKICELDIVMDTYCIIELKKNATRESTAFI